MLAYAANRSVAGKRQSSPHALLIVISAHVALAAVVISAKMDLPPKPHGPRTIIDWVPQPIDPPPNPQPVERPVARTIPTPPPPIPLPISHDDGPVVTPGPIDTGPAVIGGGGSAIVSGPSNPIKLVPIRHEPQLLTPFSELKPPYPASKLASEEEATLTLRLSIDDGGRVVGVEPVGRADRVFVEAARRHLLAHWRFSPATEDGRAVASTKTITLRFQLDG
jgi:periplasmic protein TonB